MIARPISRQWERYFPAGDPGRVFSIVADVERYPEFAPGCVGARIVERQEKRLTVDNHFGFGPARTRFRTIAELDPPLALNISSFDWPWREFRIQWRFFPESGGCRLLCCTFLDFAHRYSQPWPRLPQGKSNAKLPAHSKYGFAAGCRKALRMDRIMIARKPPFPAAVWLKAARPFSLTLSLAPVAAGAALAWANAGKLPWAAVSAAAIASALIQIGTNLYNDAADYLRGAHRAGRVGPLSAAAQGLLSPAALIRAAWLSFACAALLGLYLVYVGGWPILLLGILSIACGWAYTGGPLPIAYTPLAELFVIAFFGVGAVSGTYWLCTGTLGAAAIVCGLAIGSFAAAVLLVNNYRDIEEDKRVGRYTIAIAAGPGTARALYAAMVAAPFGLLIVLARLMPHTHVWAAFASAPLAISLIARLSREPAGPGLTKILIRTVQTQSLFTVLLCTGAVS